jgi:hypothetical protein
MQFVVLVVRSCSSCSCTTIVKITTRRQHPLRHHNTAHRSVSVVSPHRPAVIHLRSHLLRRRDSWSPNPLQLQSKLQAIKWYTQVHAHQIPDPLSPAAKTDSQHLPPAVPQNPCTIALQVFLACRHSYATHGRSWQNSKCHISMVQTLTGFKLVTKFNHPPPTALAQKRTPLLFPERADAAAANQLDDSCCPIRTLSPPPSLN